MYCFIIKKCVFFFLIVKGIGLLWYWWEMYEYKEENYNFLCFFLEVDNYSGCLVVGFYL